MAAGTLGQNLARGFYSMTYSVSASGNTTLFTPQEVSGGQTEPAATLTAHILFCQVTVATAGVTTPRFAVTDGTGGAAIMRGAPTTADVTFGDALFMTGLRQFPGFALTPGNPLVVNNTGGTPAVLDVTVIFEVK